MIIDQFLEKVRMYSSWIKRFPASVDVFAYDPEFTPRWLIDYLNAPNDDDGELLTENGGHCFDEIFSELINSSSMGKQLCYITNSHEIMETEKDDDYWGDFNYYAGWLLDNTPYLLHSPEFETTLPHRLQIFDKHVTIEIRTHSPLTEIYETVPSVRNLFFILDKELKVKKLHNWLLNTDRILVLDQYMRR
jgi:hypothetical protein